MTFGGRLSALYWDMFGSFFGGWEVVSTCLEVTKHKNDYNYRNQILANFSSCKLNTREPFFPKQLLAVRAPHNLSRRVLQTQTPNPLLQPGSLLPGVGFTAKPPVFLGFQMVVFWFSIDTFLHNIMKTTGFPSFFIPVSHRSQPGNGREGATPG